MDPQRWARSEAFYRATLAKQPDERSAYLAEARAEEPELRREIESLLACADGELKGPVAGGEQLPSGFRFGSYEIVALLGAGGTGEAFGRQRLFAALELRTASRSSTKADTAC